MTAKSQTWPFVFVEIGMNGKQLSKSLSKPSNGDSKGGFVRDGAPASADQTRSFTPSPVNVR